MELFKFSISYICFVQVKPQIKASLLLGLFSLLLLHQIIPHTHHGHKEKHEHRVTRTSHHHSHEHEHEHENENERKSEDHRDLLSILMAMHTHGGSSSEVPVVENSIQHVILKKVITDTFSPQLYVPKNAFSEQEVAELLRNYRPPPKYYDPNLSFLSLRGPPQLV